MAVPGHIFIHPVRRGMAPKRREASPSVQSDLTEVSRICWHLVVKKNGQKQQLFPEVKGQSCSVAFLMREGFGAQPHLCFLTVHQLPDRCAGACCRSSACTFASAGGSLVFAAVPLVFVFPASLAFQTVSAYGNPSHLFFQGNKIRVWRPGASRSLGHLFWSRNENEKHIKEGIANEVALCCFFVWSSSTWLSAFSLIENFPRCPDLLSAAANVLPSAHLRLLLFILRWIKLPVVACWHWWYGQIKGRKHQKTH